MLSSGGGMLFRYLDTTIGNNNRKFIMILPDKLLGSLVK